MNSYREALAIFEKRRDLLDDRVQSGIRQHRQGLAEFSFVDKGGNPVQHVHVSDSDDEEVQAELLRHIYSIWFSHPAMEAILYWNVVDGFAAYAPQGDMTAGENVYRSGFIRYDSTEKPMYRMLCNLFGKEWRTNLEVDSGERSTAAFRGFYGNYQLEITANGKTFGQEIHLTKNHPADWVIRIPGA